MMALEKDTLPRDLLICGPAGTGKTYGILAVLHCIACDYPDVRILIGRATRRALTESALVTYEQEILPADGMEAIAAGCLRRVRHSYRYPNGSEIVVTGLDKADRVLSQAWDIVYINEAIETVEEIYETLQSRLRRPGRHSWLGYLIADTNPGDPGHWLKKRSEKGLTTLWDTSHRANPGIYRDGKLTEAGRLFEEQLNRLTGTRRKRLRDGIWSIGEGAWFETFDHDKHVSVAAEIDPAHPVYLAIDSGSYTGAVWMQYRPPGVCVFGDYLSTNIGAYNAAREIIDLSRSLCQVRQGNVDFACTDPAGGSSTAIGPTVLEEYARAGLRVTRWPVKRVRESLELLESFVLTDPPEIIVHPRCQKLIDSFANYKRKYASGQWLEEPVDPQHPYEDLIDALRGGLCDHWPEGRKIRPILRRYDSRRIF